MAVRLFERLFSPLTLGSIELKNRIIMAPLTRCRANSDHIPTDLMVEYYSQRANAGLIICECTMVMKGNSAFGGREPGIYSKYHAAGWRKVTDAVHDLGGKIFLQLWHGGRACHSLLNRERQPVAPSPIPITNGQIYTPKGMKPYELPRQLKEFEIPYIIEGFRKAAKHAFDAGFDGVEIHGANGYLLDSFLRDSSNKRIDGFYGGSIQNRAKLLLEVVDAVSTVFGQDRVGVRISPLNSYNSMEDSNPVGLTSYVAKELDRRQIAYLHVMRGDFFNIQQGDVLTPARQAFKGVLIGNMGYTPEEATRAIEDEAIDAVAFGHHWISNPDLVERIEQGLPFVEPDPKTFYTQDAVGYTDYPRYSKS